MVTQVSSISFTYFSFGNPCPWGETGPDYHPLSPPPASPSPPHDLPQPHRPITGPKSNKSTNVFTIECLKIIFSFALLVREEKSLPKALRTVSREFIGEQPLESAKIMVPAIIYTVQVRHSAPLCSTLLHSAPLSKKRCATSIPQHKTVKLVFALDLK